MANRETPEEARQRIWGNGQSETAERPHEESNEGRRDRDRDDSRSGDGGERRTYDRSDSTGGVLKRTIREFKQDNLTDWAAALTYYGILAIFPAMIALVSILGLVGSSATQPMLDNLNSV